MASIGVDLQNHVCMGVLLSENFPLGKSDAGLLQVIVTPSNSTLGYSQVEVMWEKINFLTSKLSNYILTNVLSTAQE